MAIEIKTSQDFMALANLTDEERGTTDNLITINITADLDFKDIDDMESSPRICGYVNGNGHTIKNIVLSKTSNFSLFNFSGGGISGLTFENCNITVTGGNVYLINVSMIDTTFKISEIIVKNNCSFISNSYTAFCYFDANGISYATGNFDKIIVGGTWNGSKVHGFIDESASSGVRTYYRHIGFVMNVTSSNNYAGICINGGNDVYMTYCYNVSRVNMISKSASYTGGFLCGSYYLGTYISYCYASIYSVNTNIGYWYQGTYNGGTKLNYTYMCFYNSDMFGSTYGNDFQPATTEQLKSADWLREQGWVI